MKIFDPILKPITKRLEKIPMIIKLIKHLLPLLTIMLVMMWVALIWEFFEENKVTKFIEDISEGLPKVGAIQAAPAAGANSGNGDYVYYQGDYDTPFGSSTIAYAGCGVTAMAMCLSDLLNEQIDPPTCWAWTGNANYVDGDNNIYWDFFGAATEHFAQEKGVNLQWREIGTDSAAIVQALSSGHKVISSQAKSHGSVFPWGSGHIIYLCGIEDGRIKIKDPNKGNAELVAQTWDPNDIAAWSADNWEIWREG